MNDELSLEELAPWLAAIITLIGGFLRVFLIVAKGMWLDETFSVWLANHSVDEMLHWIVTLDQHPPLYYLLFHYWIVINGDSPYAARLFSALFGAATIPVIYLIGKRLSGIMVGLIAAVFLALSPFNIFYAQEARMYTFLTFNVGVAIYALAWLLTDARAARPVGGQFREYLHAWRTAPPEAAADFSYQDAARNQSGWRGWIHRHRWSPVQSIETDLAWAAFVVFSAAAMLSHNTAIFFPLAANLFVLGLMLYERIKKAASPPALQAPSFWNWVIAQIAIFILWSPWIIAFTRQAGRVAQEFWLPKPNWERIGQTLRVLLNASAPGQAIQVAMMILLCLVLIAGVVYYRKKLPIFVFLATLFAVPFLGELIVSIRRPIFIDRTLIWVTIPLLLLLAAGAVQLRYRFLIVVVVGMIGANYLFSAGDYYRFYQKEDWNTAAGYVANFAENGDLVLFNSAFVQIPFDYYFKAFEDLYSIQVEKQGVPADMLASGMLEPKMTESDIPKLIEMLRGRKRVWLVYSHDSYTDPKGLAPRTLRSQMKLLRQRDFYGGQVQLYGVP